MNNEMRKMVKKAILEYFELMFRRLSSSEYAGYSEPRTWYRRTVSIYISLSCLNEEMVLIL